MIDMYINDKVCIYNYKYIHIYIYSIDYINKKKIK